MALVKFISGDGVEHEVEETSMAAGVMRENGFQQVGGPDWHEQRDEEVPEPEVTYTEEQAEEILEADKAADANGTPDAEAAAAGAGEPPAVRRGKKAAAKK